MEEMMQLYLLKAIVQLFLRLKKDAEEPTTGTGLKKLTPKQLL